MLKENLIKEIEDKIKNNDLLTASQLNYKLSRLNPNLYELWKLQGVIFYQLGKIDLAIESFKNSINIKKNIESYYFLIICNICKNLPNQVKILKEEIKNNFNHKEYIKIIIKIDEIINENKR